MTVPIETETEIRRLYYGEHWPVGTIVSQLRVHEDVVKRVTGLLDRGPQSLREPRPMLIEPYTGFIAETLAQYPRLCASRMFDMIRARGYTGGDRGVRRYVAEVRPQPKSEAFLRLDPLIAEQAQIDWAHVGQIAVPGGVRALWVFVMVLAWSRAMWAELVVDLTAHSLLRSLVRATSFFGGTTRRWLFDNPKIVVLGRHGDAVRFHPLLLDLAGRYRTQLRLCAVRKANQKGRVERAIRYLRDRFFAGRVIHAVAPGNQELLSFIDEIAHRRPHPTLPGRTVGECFLEERGRLLPVPDPLPPTDLVEPVNVDKTAFVRFDTNRYSVPPAHASSTLMLVADDRRVRLVDGTTAVAEHARCFGRRQILEHNEHRTELLAQKRGARETKGKDRLRGAAPEIDTLYERWVEIGRNIGFMTARSLKLLELYGDDVFRAAVIDVVARGSHDPGAIAVVCEQMRVRASRPVPIPVALGDHVTDRDVVPHDLEQYDVRPRRD